MKVIFHKYFDKSYEKCSLAVKKKFKKQLKIFLENPHNPLLENHAIHSKWKDFRSINVTGDYRALYYYLDNDTAKFFIIDTHSNLYG